MADLSPFSVLVTGSNRGLGLEFVRQLLELPKPPQLLFATCRNPSAAQALHELSAQHSSVRILQLDVENSASIQEAFVSVKDQLEGLGLNLLINNAGRVIPNSFHSESAESMLQLYQTHVVGSLKMSQTFLPLLKKAAQMGPQDSLSCNRAAIINISSTGGSFTELLGWEIGPGLSYRCSKAALNMLTRCQGLILKEEGILCAAIHPGWVQTDLGNCRGFLAPMKKEESVQGMLKVFSTLSEKNAGYFFDWEGKELCW
ncbi:C-factor-like isoform X1 [Monodelphis domestica]|uniref:C-factor-like isoform X1 n=1 Tax=Monodelphis domestica TaxID=13616 RepID=UPI0024E1DD13|nr:C-factor-like isoform X1 [Monodelphis domestica]